MIETGLAFLVALLSGLVPVLNIELYLVGAVVAVDDGALVAMAVAAGLGQTLGKLPYYYVGRGTISAPWLRRRAATPGRWAARAERWREKAQERPVWGLGLVALSSFASVPPFLIVSVLAGVVRIDVWRFAAITFVTRTARFLIVVYAPAWAMSYLPG
ncbi:VTT domain-containing protein [Nocardiopsis aegyptia]|uniref:VTT domain-containing protein n=1 Tax=Nocardiopsis aegyptia TaxID=220378 RepID=UPI00366A5E8F